MTAPRSTQVSPRPEAATHPRRPVHAQPGPARATDRHDTEPAEGLVGRLEEVRTRLRALVPLVHDEGARLLAAALGEVDAVLAELHPDPSTPPTGTRTTSPPPSPGASPAPGHWAASTPPQGHRPATTTGRAGRHRPPALPCGPDYPLLPDHREP